MIAIVAILFISLALGFFNPASTAETQVSKTEVSDNDMLTGLLGSGVVLGIVWLAGGIVLGFFLVRSGILRRVQAAVGSQIARGADGAAAVGRLL